MPIRIKKPDFKPNDKKFCKSSAAAMGASVIFGAVMALSLGTIVSTGSPLLSTVLFAAYLFYFAMCVTAFVFGINAYRLEDNLPDLAVCIVYLASMIFCIMNLRFALAIIFSAYGLEHAADTVIGNVSYSEFVESQYTSWICIFGGIVMTCTAGIFASVKLIRNRK